jgi:TDG/mug DNA glycosylase family protein
MLPDLFPDLLDVVFVSINPSTYSVEQGHYFARRSNKFWPCISRSTLTLTMRTDLGAVQLGPEHDVLLPRYGIGFTDLVKRATPRASDVTPAEFAAGVNVLLEKIHRLRPRVACFQGMTAYQYVHRALGGAARSAALGLQPASLGKAAVFVVPNPSGANAHFSRAEQTAWYDQLAERVPARGKSRR